MERGQIKNYNHLMSDLSLVGSGMSSCGWNVQESLFTYVTDDIHIYNV